MHLIWRLQTALSAGINHRHKVWPQVWLASPCIPHLCTTDITVSKGLITPIVLVALLIFNYQGFQLPCLAVPFAIRSILALLMKRSRSQSA